MALKQVLFVELGQNVIEFVVYRFEFKIPYVESTLDATNQKEWKTYYFIIRGMTSENQPIGGFEIFFTLFTLSSRPL